MQELKVKDKVLLPSYEEHCKISKVLNVSPFLKSKYYIYYGKVWEIAAVFIGGGGRIAIDIKHKTQIITFFGEEVIKIL